VLKKSFQNVNFLEDIKSIIVDPIYKTELSYEGLKILGNSEYTLENNIPKLIPFNIPKAANFTDQVKALWGELQDLEYKMYLDDPVGVFSHENHESANEISKIILELSSGSILDIGCGALSRPSYMPISPKINFYGIDPYFGDKQRSFPFIQALGEFIPFSSFSFDNAIIATSLDHVFFPHMVFSDTYRVLKNGGKLFVWQTIYEEKHDNYIRWKNLKDLNPLKAAQFDKYHQWAFTENSLMALAEEAGFKKTYINILNKNNMPDKTNSLEVLFLFEKIG